LLSDDEHGEDEERLAEIALDPAGYLAEDEDVHSAIERQLGAVGRKIHAGRSRNDQVAAAFRLYVVDACAEARREIEALALVVLTLAETEADTLFPGYTHLQRGQPVTLGHHLLAWIEMLDRDRSRPRPQGGVDRELRSAPARSPASTLGLPGPPNQMRNSIDAVADRDRARLPLRRDCPLRAPLADRRGDRALVVGRVGFVKLPENAATGSSMMPQKLNPRRRRAARGQGHGDRTPHRPARDGQGFLAYDRDLQEDKAPVFAARATRGSGLCSSRRSSPAGGRSRAHGCGGVGRSCLRPTRQRRSCRTACRSARRTSGWPRSSRRVVHAGRHTC
jgi:argininosuccinate lyase